MKVEGAAALVTGANRGLGAAIAQALLDAGAKVYGAVRDPATITNQGLIAVPLDVTDGDDIAIAARTCRDVSIVVNNAGILRSSASLAEGAVDAARAEMETNFFGSMRMARAFAPVLRRNGGGRRCRVFRRCGSGRRRALLAEVASAAEALGGLGIRGGESEGEHGSGEQGGDSHGFLRMAPQGHPLAGPRGLSLKPGFQTAT